MAVSTLRYCNIPSSKSLINQHHYIPKPEGPLWIIFNLFFYEENSESVDKILKTTAC